MTEPKLYNLEEVANMLRVSRQTIYKHIWAGRLPAVKIGREYRITETQLQQILQNGLTGNTNK